MLHCSCLDIDGLMVPDTSHGHWRSLLRQVLRLDHKNRIPAADMSNQPVASSSGIFMESPLLGATVDKEGFVIFPTFRLVGHSLWNGFHIHTYRRNLTYIFNPLACVSSAAKELAQRLLNWEALWGWGSYSIERNSWGKLWSRRVAFPALWARALAIHTLTDPDDSSPLNTVMPAAQKYARAL